LSGIAIKLLMALILLYITLLPPRGAGRQEFFTIALPCRKREWRT